MALEITDLFITSDVTPETARHIPGTGWFLSWLPTTTLTREQAVSGMVLDEILSDPDLTDATLAMELAALRAADLGTDLVDVVIRLYARILDRDHRESTPSLPALTA
ncbi:hypothetical protein [Nocardia sp. NPDC050710]|uniref:hypothetical protein n=1 Tax=Nocardia sp. NPDC050710 TaxID=3157220 RepID=UPI0033D0FD69